MPIGILTGVYQKLCTLTVDHVWMTSTTRFRLKGVCSSVTSATTATESQKKYLIGDGLFWVTRLCRSFVAESACQDCGSWRSSTVCEPQHLLLRRSVGQRGPRNFGPEARSGAVRSGQPTSPAHRFEACHSPTLPGVSRITHLLAIDEVPHYEVTSKCTAAGSSCRGPPAAPSRPEMRFRRPGT